MINRSCQTKESARTDREQRVGYENYSVPPLYNLPELIPLKIAAKVLNVSIKTLYDWKYRGKVRKTRILPNLFTRICGQLYLRKDILKAWVFGRNSS